MKKKAVGKKRKKAPFKTAKKDFERGKIETVDLKKPFIFNGGIISKAIIEIDHINYGLDKKTRKLNTTKRSNFTLADIEKFLGLLNDEYIAATSHKGRISRYELRINSPIAGKFFGREYLMVFEINYDTSNLIHTITLFPNW